MSTSEHRSKPSGSRRWWHMGAAVLALALHGAPAGAVDKLGLFELDGEASDAITALPDDWQSFGNSGNPVARTKATDPGYPGIVSDPYGTTIFTGGGSKDIYDIPKWNGKSGSVPPKDEITNAYAAAYIVPQNGVMGSTAGDLVIYAGLDRYATNGDANVGFWFFQDAVSYDSGTGKFSGKHSVGDLLVVAAFTNGGRVGNLLVYEWNGSTIQKVDDIADADCTSPHGLDDPCGRSNSKIIQLFWPYAAQSPIGTNMAPPGAFVEVGVNISALARSYNLPLPCFGSFMAETRSSTADNAVLKDFVAPAAFPVCSVKITKACGQGIANYASDGTTITGITWPFNGTVTNNGAGRLYDLKVIDAGPDMILGNADDFQVGSTVTSLDPAESFDFADDFTTPGTKPNPATNIARVVASTTAGAVPSVKADSETATCQSPPSNPKLSVTKSCETTLDIDASLQRVLVGVDVKGEVCNTGDVGLQNISATDDNGTLATGDDTLLFSGVSLKAGDCKSYTQHYNPSAVNAGVMPLTKPSNASFMDTVTAKGKDALYGTAVEGSRSATCPLCSCTDCPP